METGKREPSRLLSFLHKLRRKRDCLAVECCNLSFTDQQDFSKLPGAGSVSVAVVVPKLSASGRDLLQV